MIAKRFFLLLLFFYCALVHAEQNSIFWQIQDEKGKSHYLFGTIHVDDDRVTNFHQNVIDALSNSEIFLNETNEISDFSVLYSKKPIIEDQLLQKDLDLIKELSYQHKIPYEKALKMKPWLLAVIFTSPKPISPFIQDNLLKMKAIENGLITQGIETVNEHFEALDFLSDDEQIEMLSDILKQSEENKLKDYESLIESYLSMDLKKINLIDEKNTSNLISKKIWIKIKDKLLTKRNYLFVSRVSSLFDGNRLFIAVGASHLGGEDGLLEAFKAMGFRLTPIQAFKD